jgi:uncharacterized glyoxalase superfamily protein PhnB
MSTAVPRITPYLYYRDLDRALKWLAEAFGWQEKMRATGADGRAFHAEMVVGADAAVMMGCPGPDYLNPRDLGHVTQSLYVRVDDVDSLFARATTAGATVIEEPADQPYGDRRCALEDCEGHHWFFAQTVGGGR